MRRNAPEAVASKAWKDATFHGLSISRINRVLSACIVRPRHGQFPLTFGVNRFVRNRGNDPITRKQAVRAPAPASVRRSGGTSASTGARGTPASGSVSRRRRSRRPPPSPSGRSFARAHRRRRAGPSWASRSWRCASRRWRAQTRGQPRSSDSRRRRHERLAGLRLGSMEG